MVRATLSIRRAGGPCFPRIELFGFSAVQGAEAHSDEGDDVKQNIRAIDLTLPLVVVAAVALAVISPGGGKGAAVEVPVTGAVVDPCTGEEVTFGGTAEVVASSRPDGAAGYHVELVADLSRAEGKGESGTPYDLDGAAAGEGAAPPPFPASVSIEGAGTIVMRGETDTLAAVIRFQLTVAEDGGVTPTGAAEVNSLACGD